MTKHQNKTTAGLARRDFLTAAAAVAVGAHAAGAQDKKKAAQRLVLQLSGSSPRGRHRRRNGVSREAVRQKNVGRRFLNLKKTSPFPRLRYLRLGACPL